MIKFLLKGILRDKNRSLLPVIIVSIGVMLTVLLSGYIRGAMGDIITQNAIFDTGHVKVMTRAYAANKDQLPNDLAFLDANDLMKQLESEITEMTWVRRIRFGGLVDIPDEKGFTISQAPAAALAVELFNDAGGEVQRLKIVQSVVQGSVPVKPEEILMGHEFADKLDVQIGDTVTFFGSTVHGSMSFANLVVSGTIRFGSSIMDRGMVILDISKAQNILDLENGTSEILGYFKLEAYDDDRAQMIAENFNAKFDSDPDEYAPEMFRLKDQNNLAGYLDYVDIFSGLFVGIFVLAMSVVLWNTGLLGGLRRYQEYGIRLALGEAKGRIYKTMVLEAILIGIMGSVLGTALGLIGTYYMQTVGIDITEYIKDSTMLMPSVIRSKFTPDLLYIGFIPGLFAMVFGNMLSGIGIYKRETAMLFKELEV